MHDFCSILLLNCLPIKGNSSGEKIGAGLGLAYIMLRHYNDPSIRLLRYLRPTHSGLPMD